MLEFGQRDEDVWHEILGEIIRKQGDVVYEHEWDSGGPGAGADSELIYEFRKLYWPSSSVEGLYGPFDDLGDAIRSGDFNKVTDATTAISCGAISTSELVKMLSVIGTPKALPITINGEDWTVGPQGDLQPCKP